MKRQQIEQEFTLRNETIQDPGQFEGEMLYAPHFWEVSLEGCAEELSAMEDGQGEYACLVEITDDERETMFKSLDIERILRRPDHRYAVWFRDGRLVTVVVLGVDDHGLEILGVLW